MTREEAEAEMVRGYLDGFRGDPDPGNNRSHCYRHGWINGNADRNGRGDQWRSIEHGKRVAENCVAADMNAYNF